MSRRCCCDVECLLFEDDFTRVTDPDTDLGSDWDEISGDWDISSGTLRENGNSGALVFCTTLQNEEEALAKVTIMNPTSGDVFRLIINAVDQDNYFYGQYEASGSSYRFVIGERSAGAGDVEIDEWTESATPNMIELCLTFTGGRLALRHGVGDTLWGPATDTGGRKAGLSNQSGNTLEFDQFSLWRHKLADPTCPMCVCYCDQSSPPHSLTATFQATSKCISDLDGLTIVMPRVEGVGYRVEWYGNVDICAKPPAIPSPLTWDLLLTCAEVPSQWRLSTGCLNGLGTQCVASKWYEGPAPDPACTRAQYPDIISCDPLVLEFGPFVVHDTPGGEMGGACLCCQLTASDNPNGTYYITIAET